MDIKSMLWISSYAGKWGNHCNELLSKFLYVLMDINVKTGQYESMVLWTYIDLLSSFFSVKFGSNEILYLLVILIIHFIQFELFLLLYRIRKKNLNLCVSC